MSDRHASSTLAEMLVRHAERTPNAAAYSFVPEDDFELAEHVDFAELHFACSAVAHTLESVSARGDRVLVCCPAGQTFVTAFLGCLLAGRIAVPVDATPSDRQLASLATITEDCRPTVAIAPVDQIGRLTDRFRVNPLLAALRVVPCDGPLTPFTGALPSPDEIAFLQYTSGSTTAPRGVRVRHDNLVDNLTITRDAFGHTPDSGNVTWLPPFHDMGLIGGLLQSLFVGFHTAVLSPRTFLRRPRSWLAAISHFGATTSGGPPSAFDQCTRRITEEESEKFDLSSWDAAFVGAEPISPAVLERFAGRFGRHGFRASSIFPCYGLAEATLMVSGGPRGRGARVLRSDPAAVVDPTRPGSPRRNLLSVGPVQTGSVQIVDPVTARVVAADGAGEIWLQGPSVADGYWRNPDGVGADPFGSSLADGAGGTGTYLRTGDLGFVRDGELYVTGRLKELIILNGRNVFPHDIEASIEGSRAYLRPEGTVVFGIRSEDGEQLVVLQEIDLRATGGMDRSGVESEIRQIVARAHGLAVWRVAFIRRGRIPRTTSGKKQRGQARQLFLAGGTDHAGDYADQ